MKKARVLTLVLILCIIFTALCPAALADSAPNISAKNAIVIEQTSGMVLYEKSADAKAAPASTTKIMTLLLTCEAIERGEVSYDDKIYASAEDIYIIDSDASNAGIAPGEVLTLRDLCYCAMLASANEATNLIASHVAGSVSAFVEMMNGKAEELGCENTHFVNTNGLPNEEHYTTARELAVIAQEAMKHMFVRELCAAAEYTVPETNVSEPRELINSNALVNPKSYYGKEYFTENAYGIKTGHTEAAGYCLVSAIKEGDLDLLCVVLGATGDGKEGKYFNNFADTLKLVDYCKENFHCTTVLSADEVLGKIPVEKGRQKALPLSSACDVSILLPDDAKLDSFERTLTLNYEAVPAPVKKGAIIGSVDVTNADGELLCSCELVAAKDVNASIIDYVLANAGSFVSENIAVLSVIVLILVAAVFAAVYIPHIKKGKGKK